MSYHLSYNLSPFFFLQTSASTHTNEASFDLWERTQHFAEKLWPDIRQKRQHILLWFHICKSRLVLVETMVGCCGISHGWLIFFHSKNIARVWAIFPNIHSKWAPCFCRLLKSRKGIITYTLCKGHPEPDSELFPFRI